MRTYGGRGKEGRAVFSVPVSEVLYWKEYRREHFWDRRIDSLRINEQIRAKRPERREKTREMVEELFEEKNLL